jgi:hypothetical protein
MVQREPLTLSITGLLVNKPGRVGWIKLRKVMFDRTYFQVFTDLKKLALGRLVKITPMSSVNARAAQYAGRILLARFSI